MGPEGFLQVDVSLPLRLMPPAGECSAQEGWLLQMGNDSAQGSLSADPSALSPKPQIPDSLAALVHSALPLLEPRVSGCKWNSVGWLFKRLSASLAVSPWQTETLLLFTTKCYLGSFLNSVTLGWGAQLEVWITYFSGGSPLDAEISLWNIGCHPWEPCQPSRTSTLPTSLIVVMWFLP